MLDASVLIGLLDSADSHHDCAVDEVEQADRAQRELLTPASACGEALVAFARVDQSTDARAAVTGTGISTVPLTAQIAVRAAMLRAQHDALRLPDALMRATAQEHPARLLTYDDRLARTVGQQPER
jgi:predicted nucleic acid-binding protein